MDSCIRNGVTSLEPVLPGPFKVRRRAPGLYRRLQKGFYPTMEKSSGCDVDGSSAERGIAKRIGRAEHALQTVPFRTTPVFPGIEYLSCMAIAVNEVNASGGRVVTAP
jgi:L-serine deaminase